MKARVPERERGVALEGRREGRPAGVGAADREQRDEPVLQRDGGSTPAAWRRGSARVPGSASSLGVGSRAGASSRPSRAAAPGPGAGASVGQTDPSRQGEALGRPAPGSRPPPRPGGSCLRGDLSRGPAEVEAREERRPRLAVAGLRRRARGAPRRRGRPPGPGRPPRPARTDACAAAQPGAPPRDARAIMDGDHQGCAEPVGVEQAVRPAQAGRRLHDLADLDGPAHDVLVTARLRALGGSLAGRGPPARSPPWPKDRRAVGAGVCDARSTASRQASAAHRGARPTARRLWSPARRARAGSSRSAPGWESRRRHADGVGQSVEAASNGGESSPNLAERAFLAAHGREYRNRPGPGQRLGRRVLLAGGRRLEPVPGERDDHDLGRRERRPRPRGARRPPARRPRSARRRGPRARAGRERRRSRESSTTRKRPPDSSTARRISSDRTGWRTRIPSATVSPSPGARPSAGPASGAHAALWTAMSLGTRADRAGEDQLAEAKPEPEQHRAVADGRDRRTSGARPPRHSHSS